MTAFAVGDIVLRILDEMEFEVQVLSVSSEGLYNIKYLDDGNVEGDVPENELKRQLFSVIPAVQSDSSVSSPLTDRSSTSHGEIQIEWLANGPIVNLPRVKEPMSPAPVRAGRPRISFSTYHAIKRELLQPCITPVHTQDDSGLITTRSTSSSLRRTVSHSALCSAALDSANTTSLSLEPLASYCERCFKPCIYRCKACLKSFYCCKKCQAAAWPAHKLQCFNASSNGHALLAIPNTSSAPSSVNIANSFQTPPRKRLPLSNSSSTAARAVENVLDWLQDDNEVTMPISHPTVIKYNQPTATTASILNAVTCDTNCETKSNIKSVAESSAVMNIVEMFNLPQEEASHCLAHFNGSADQAVEWLLLHPDSLPSLTLIATTVSDDDLYGNWGKDELDVKWGKHNQHLCNTASTQTVDRLMNALPSVTQSFPTVISAGDTPAAVSIYSGFVDIEERKCNMELRKSRVNDAEIVCYLYPKADVSADVVSAATAKCHGIKYHTSKDPDTVIRLQVEENNSITGLKCVGVVHVIKLTVTQINTLLQSVTGADSYKFLNTNSIAYGTQAAKVLQQHIRSCVMSPFYENVIKDYVVLTYQVFGPTGLFYAQSEKTERVEIAYYSIHETNDAPTLPRVDSLETHEGDAVEEPAVPRKDVNMCEVGMIVEIMGCSAQEASRVLQITGDVTTAIDMMMGGTDINDPPPLISNID